VYVRTRTAVIRVRLNDFLRQRGLSQRELARRTETHPDVISRFARQATSAVSYELLSRICSELDCAPGDLLEFAPDPSVQIPIFEEPKSVDVVDRKLMNASEHRGTARKAHRPPREKP